jgi:hypothetical protein
MNSGDLAISEDERALIDALACDDDEYTKTLCDRVLREKQDRDDERPDAATIAPWATPA